MNLQTFISFAEKVFDTFLLLSTEFAKPLSVWRLESTGFGLFWTLLEGLLGVFPPVRDFVLSLSVYDIVFSSGTIIIIIAVGIVRWILDILP